MHSKREFPFFMADSLESEVSEFAVLLWTAGRTDRVNGWSEKDFRSALRCVLLAHSVLFVASPCGDALICAGVCRWASDLEESAAAVDPSSR